MRLFQLSTPRYHLKGEFSKFQHIFELWWERESRNEDGIGQSTTADKIGKRVNDMGNKMANCFSPQIDTVHPSESKSRRWKSLNTQDTSALSAERPPSRDTPLVSGIASHARRPLLEELTPSRMFWNPSIQLTIRKFQNLTY